MPMSPKLAPKHVAEQDGAPRLYAAVYDMDLYVQTPSSL
jgi:hypothetical protein